MLLHIYCTKVLVVKLYYNTYIWKLWSGDSKQISDKAIKGLIPTTHVSTHVRWPKSADPVPAQLICADNRRSDTRGSHTGSKPVPEGIDKHSDALHRFWWRMPLSDSLGFGKLNYDWDMNINILLRSSLSSFPIDHFLGHAPWSLNTV